MVPKPDPNYNPILISSHTLLGGRIKHYMIDQTPDGQYQVVGNRKLFPSLNELVAYHKKNKVFS